MTDASVSPNAQKRKREESEQDITDERQANAKRLSNDKNGTDPSESSFLEHQEGDMDYSAMNPQASEHQNGAADHASATSTAAAALGLYPTMTIPQPTDVTFAAQASEGDRGPDSSFSMTDSAHKLESHLEGSFSSPSLPRTQSKPPVGSEEWHKVRKDNHKEVERRRRETINEGINELAKLIPGSEKNKGSILQRAVQFIVQLKENETQNIEKWTLEKLLTEQAIAELSASNDKLKAECERAWREVETWKKTCQSAGIAPKEEDGATEN